MALSLKESQAVSGLADLLYDFLPGSGAANWKGHVSFRTVAQSVGVGHFWQQGSKRPMMNALLRQTLEQRHHLFEKLILEIVKGGMTYRQKSDNPITPEEIDTLNGYILTLGFKFPDLWDREFRDSFRTDSAQRAKEQVDQALQQEELKATAQKEQAAELARLQQEFFTLHAQTDRKAAGLQLEKVLNRLFAISDLEPRKPFRIVGEQIDGSFELDHDTYIVEAKWEKDPLPEADLLVLRGKVEGKSEFTRGLLVAINGISNQAKQAITQGKRPNFFVCDGYDLTVVLSGEVTLVNLLRQKRRILGEEGLVYVPYSELWAGARARTG